MGKKLTKSAAKDKSKIKCSKRKTPPTGNPGQRSLIINSASVQTACSVDLQLYLPALSGRAVDCIDHQAGLATLHAADRGNSLFADR